MKLKYLPGLNALRFFAAFFVVIYHANISLFKLGIWEESPLSVFNRGGEAVNLFFTLSGFLITYLLLIEIAETGNISIRKFYLRRIYRIWPLYFLIVAIGFIGLGKIYPKIFHQPYFHFPLLKGFLMYLFFLPNYASTVYLVGLLYPLWSIGVEEQFYFFWAPCMKLFKYRSWIMIWLFVLVSTGFYMLLETHVFNFSPDIQNFLLTQKFYAMAIGSLFGMILFQHYSWYSKSFLASRFCQFIVAGIITWHYFIGFPFSELLDWKIVLAFLYGLLFLNVSAIPNKLLNLELPFLSYLGILSFGIYMFHMPVDYVLRLIVPKLKFWGLSRQLIIPLYFLSLMAGAIVVAAFSHRYFESYFLKLKDKFHTKPKPIGAV